MTRETRDGGPMTPEITWLVKMTQTEIDGLRRQFDLAGSRMVRAYCDGSPDLEVLMFAAVRANLRGRLRAVTRAKSRLVTI